MLQKTQHFENLQSSDDGDFWQCNRSYVASQFQFCCLVEYCPKVNVAFLMEGIVKAKNDTMQYTMWFK